MFVIGFGVGMTGQTGKICVVGGIGVAICALVPFAFVFAAVNGEMLVVVVESRRYPGVFAVTIGAVGRKIQRHVTGVGGSIVIGSMAADAGIGSIVVIAVVAFGAVGGNSGMRAVKRVIIVVIGEGSRHPTRRGSMAGCAVGR